MDGKVICALALFKQISLLERFNDLTYIHYH